MGRTFGTDNSARNYVSMRGGPTMWSTTSASLCCWFRHTTSGLGSGGSAFVFDQSAGANPRFQVYFGISSGARGKLNANLSIAAGSTTSTISGTVSVDDGQWHRLLVVRRPTSPILEMFIDGISDARNTTATVGTSATAATLSKWGGNSASYANGAFGNGTLARCAIALNQVLTPEEADTFLYTGRAPVKLSQWIEMGIGAVQEPDWSGSGMIVSVSGTTLASNPPCMTGFGSF